MAFPATSLDLVRGDSSPGFDASRVPLALQSTAVAFSNAQAAALRANLRAAEQLHSMLELQSAERVLPLGVSALDAVLPRGGLMQGSVIELQVHGAGSAATSFALCACRAAQRAGEQQAIGPHSVRAFDAQRPWCAFIDPSASLFAPGVAQLGVELERLLVVRPDLDAIERVAIRIAEAKIVSLLVIDLRGALGGLPVSSQRWPRTVRRLALAVRHVGTCVLVITPSEPRAALPLPVAMRLEFSRTRADSFELRVGKERSGRVSTACKIPWSVFDAPWSPSPQDSDRKDDAPSALCFQQASSQQAAFQQAAAMRGTAA